MGLLVWPRNQATVAPVKAIITQPQHPLAPTKARQVQISMLTVLTFTELCIINFSTRKNCEPTQLHCHIMVSVGKCTVKTTEKWNLRECFLPHRNAPAHTALVCVWIMGENKTSVIQHSPYSPDLASFEFLVSQNSKWCWRLNDITTFQTNLGTLAEFKHLLHEMLQTVVLSLDLLYKDQHRLPWKGQSNHGR